MTINLDPKDSQMKRLDSENYVEGYASTFERYKLYGDGDTAIYEQFERSAFDKADMSDVILQFDHEGPVFARTSNHTLGLDVDNVGLFVYADLGKTSRSRELYEDIKAGNVNKMSFRFKCDGYFDETTRTHVITNVSKIYDVSAVSIPANDTTCIEARAKETAQRSRDLELLKLKVKLMKGDK